MSDLPGLLLGLKLLNIKADASPTKKQRMAAGGDDGADYDDSDGDSDSYSEDPNEIPPWQRDGAKPITRPPSPSAVFNGWVPGSQSTAYLDGAYVEPAKKERKPVVLIRAECPVELFLKLATGRLGFKNDTGEPNDWMFGPGGTHETFQTKFEPDYCYLEMEWNDDDDDPEDWKCTGHDGRHRASWIMNNLGIDVMVIHIGVTMPANPLRPNEPRKPRVMDTILEQWVDEKINPRCSAKLMPSRTVPGVNFRLEQLPPPGAAGAGASSASGR